MSSSSTFSFRGTHCRIGLKRQVTLYSRKKIDGYRKIWTHLLNFTSLSIIILKAKQNYNFKCMFWFSLVLELIINTCIEYFFLHLKCGKKIFYYSERQIIEKFVLPQKQHISLIKCMLYWHCNLPNSNHIL